MERSDIAVRSAGCGCLVVFLGLAACGEQARDEPSEATEVPQMSMPEDLRQQLFGELERARLALREMRTVQGPVIQARMLEPGPTEIVDGSEDPASWGAYTRQARLLADGSEITVYIPHDVLISPEVVVDVMVGEHGHYFVGVVAEP